jgi:two-component system, NtrC family, sensor kinase
MAGREPLNVNASDNKPATSPQTPRVTTDLQPRDISRHDEPGREGAPNLPRELPSIVAEQQLTRGRSRLPAFWGLRAQIILALCAVFAISYALLGTTAIGLIRHAMDRDQTAFSQTVARGLATVLDQLPDSSDKQLNRAIKTLLRGVPESSVRVQRKDGTIYTYGPIREDRGTPLTLLKGDRLEFWLSSFPNRSIAALTNLLLFYVALTGGGVVLLTYIALTYWIVRPIENLIRSSERLAAGAYDVTVPIAGAAEVTRLAIAFNQMASQLRTDRLSLEQRLRELEQSTQELRTAQQQVIHGEKLATVGRLAAGVSHEIGNPLAAILGLVELIQGDTLSKEEEREFLARIGAETERIHKIIRDLLDFSRRSVDSEELSMTSDLKQIIDDAVNLVKPQKEMRGVEIVVSRPEALPRIIGPQHKLTQVFLNLLLNAADALNGKGKIAIEIKTNENNDRVSIAVSDNGPGIDAKIMDKLFEPFTTTKPPGKGTGLGLAVCHALVESVGGALTATNRPEGGARFDIQLRVDSNA